MKVSLRSSRHDESRLLPSPHVASCMFLVAQDVRFVLWLDVVIDDDDDDDST